MRGINLLTVNKYLFADAQHAQAAETHQLVTLLQRIVDLIRLIRRLRRRDVQLVARLGDKLTEPLLELCRLVNQLEHHSAQLIQLLRQNIRRVLTRRHVRIAVAVAAQLALQDIVRKAADHLPTAWRTEAHRVVH